ncbi:uncharacterized protein C8Q71DRAFT_319912 [Rhodofomes roseus]|uniref:FAD-dependent oxidoreductase 2 FAD-binding domain-containing protein n=1 Tax=Rhodofomes roseus TaxID=34475 RepID=A0ABQ8K200_9APHY|nr:uncharacterized protein C8Q71DRAFT_319912 [Rhodofomes roseus]KAH9830726.1 hypothetical protein C8Q71DRAFT_319912 [Rhodofomes roseus]
MTTPTTPDFVQIQVVIIGAGIAGLTAAIALRRVGHKVIMLEQDSDVNTHYAGGCRLAPNIALVYKRWGLYAPLREIGIILEHAEFPGFHTGTVAAGGDWVEDMKDASGANHWSLRYEDFRKVLADTAKASGVVIRLNSLAVSITVKPEKAAVKLASGELIVGDLVVAADGRDEVEGKRPVSRPMMLGDQDHAKFKRLMMYNALIPGSAMRSDPALARFLPKGVEQGSVILWHGDSYGAIGFPTRMDEFCIHVYCPAAEPAHDSILMAGPADLLRAMEAGKAEPQLKKLAAAAHTVVGIPVRDRPSLEDWVHPDGPMIVIGEAAHPLTTGALTALNLAAGDGMLLGRLFKNLHRKEQIGSFLSALVENRQKRITDVRNAERLNPATLSLPAGVDQARYLKTTVQHMGDEGIQAFGEEVCPARLLGFVLLSVPQAIRNTFSYDPEDEADTWWVEWGLLQERAAKITPITPLNLSSDVHARTHSIS